MSMAFFVPLLEKFEPLGSRKAGILVRTPGQPVPVDGDWHQPVDVWVRCVAPGFVYASCFVFHLLNTFAVNMVLQYRQVGK